MGSVEVLHEIIYTNLFLLKEKGHNINFEEGMFRQRNQPGFEKVGHALLTVIDPVECKKTIPWPLCNDKNKKSEFRTQFVKFIKKINEKHPDAQIPEMTASHLQNPGGEKFLLLMYKLSTFSLKLELMRMLGTEEQRNMLPQPDCSKISEETVIKINIVKGACCQMDHSTQQYTSLESVSTPKLQQLKLINKHLASEVESVKMELKNTIRHLEEENEHFKNRLLDIEDQEVMTEWNLKTEEKIEELENSANKLLKMRDLSAKSCQLIKAVKEKQNNILCLDGSQLFIPPAISELAGTPVTNMQGHVRLEVLLRAGAAAARRLIPSPQPISQPSLLPLARNMLKDALQQKATVEEITQSLDALCSESKKAIDQLIPVIIGEMEKKKFPDHLNYLDDRPPLQFICKDAIPSYLSPVDKNKRMSLNTMVNLYPEKGRRVICSVRKRRSLNKYSFEQTPRHQISATPTPRFGFRVPSTCVPQRTRLDTLLRNTTKKPLIATTVSKKPVNRSPESGGTRNAPACKRSIYGKLPTGPREQVEEDFTENSLSKSQSHLVSLSETLTPHKSQASMVSELETPKTEEWEVASPPKKPRKSLLALVERYNKLKATMKPITPKRK